MKNFSENIKYIGVDDRDLDLFEGQYVVPEGMAYNSYVIVDEKIAVTDTVDAHKVNEWLANLEAALAGRKPDYLVIHHLEPDHAGGIADFVAKYPEATLVASAKAFALLPQFMALPAATKTQTVKEGDTLTLGAHTLQFIGAPMVHWPEVLFSYEQSEKVLFAADAFGKFGVYDADPDDWACEARRYYFNIVGKYGNQVQAVLKKAAALDIKTICPLHGPVLTENLGYYIDKYNTWSSYAPEDKGVLVAYASIYGGTKKAAELLGEKLTAAGVEKVVVSDLARSDMAEVIEDAFRYDRMVVAAPTYDAGLFPVMEDFLNHLKAKNFSNRKVGVVENGTWAPMAAKKMTEILSSLKNVTLAETVVTVKSTLSAESEAAMDKLVSELL
ncbi:FprA family A-type flavoprotein [Fibrobacter sp.]|uniref:FprA family A-type flavoprotein n=1 Tax=Fibrobacter sp. TaxID=35828 RepID=UPI0025BDA735|nr:FprA family A-type flavoprotein [Fibrobacter sp.]MBS7272905.1 FprA family A-type flavoprotein [Fibrobacter sp.]MCI6438494.1 FprA family A-type flavoprotein [Fibrobacter sp.]